MRFRRMHAITLTLAAVVSSSCARQSSSRTEIQVPDEQGSERDDKELLTPAVRARGLKVRSLGWTEPTYTPAEEQAVMEIYQYMDPNHEIAPKLLRKALLYFHRNRELIPNKNYLLVVDFSPHSRKYRMFMLNMLTGGVGSMHTSHGKGSDAENDGLAESFSNIPDSNQSSLGFFLTGETYVGVHGYSLRIDGLSQTNSNVRDRAIVIHGADYVVEDYVKQGRSLGCFALAWENRAYVIDRVKNGSLIYAGLSRE